MPSKSKAPNATGKGTPTDNKKDNKNKAAGKGKNKDEAAESSGKQLKPATAINARHILCEKHSKKEEALTKLRDGGKFDDVAREFSEDKARQGGLHFPHLFHVYLHLNESASLLNGRLLPAGGSLGWKTRGALDAAFEKAAYDVEPSTTNSPKFVEVKTGHGYHIIMVEGRR
ncbi:MAG: hypothetical protein Q9220_001977 [cf. Caloplaca sp. 1 TL-2023]